ncbi:MAG: hypothetical protein HY925_09385 [Elusimicrobia bacterium]|nr:hypothetical protein [Elusimicrobiota bacterium]
MAKWMLALVIALCGTSVFADNNAGGAPAEKPAAADQGMAKKEDMKANKGGDKKPAKKAKKARKGKKAEEKKAEAAPAAPAQK